MHGDVFLPLLFCRFPVQPRHSKSCKHDFLSRPAPWLNCYYKTECARFFLLITVVYLWYNQMIYYSKVWNGREWI